MRDFRELQVFHKAHQLVLQIYKVTADYPRHETYGLTSQMRRAAMSIPMNIAEGCGKGTNAELARYMQISMGSASELEYQLLLSHDLGYLPDDIYKRLESQAVEVKRMLAPFINYLHQERKR